MKGVGNVVQALAVKVATQEIPLAREKPRDGNIANLVGDLENVGLVPIIDEGGSIARIIDKGAGAKLGDLWVRRVLRLVTQASNYYRPDDPLRVTDAHGALYIMDGKQKIVATGYMDNGTVTVAPYSKLVPDK